MLEELVKKDEYWRKIALKLCGCKFLADDIVHDMYIKLSENEKELNISYVYNTIRSLFIDHVRKSSKEVVTNDFKRITEQNDTYTTQERYELLEMLKDVSWFEREVLLHTHEKSLREAEEELGVHYGVLNYHKHKALKKLKDKHNGRSTER